MADGIEIDMSQIGVLASDVSAAPRVAGLNVRKALEVTARHIRDDWRDSLQGSRNLPHGSRSVFYDIRGGRGIRADSIEAEIGPELDRSQGSIVGLVETGTPTLSPRGYGLQALEANIPDFERGLEIAIEDVL